LYFLDLPLTGDRLTVCAELNIAASRELVSTTSQPPKMEEVATMKRIFVILAIWALSEGLANAQNVATPGRAPRLETGAAASANTLIGSAPRLGPVSGRTSTVNVPVDVTRNSVVPLHLVQGRTVSPRPPTLLDRLAQLLPFAARTGASVVAPEAVILHDSLPNVTIK
jgi:hypothetical protein